MSTSSGSSLNISAASAGSFLKVSRSSAYVMRVGRPTFSTSQVLRTPSARSWLVTYLLSKTPGSMAALGLTQRMKQQLVWFSVCVSANMDLTKVPATVAFLMRRVWPLPPPLSVAAAATLQIAVRTADCGASSWYASGMLSLLMSIQLPTVYFTVSAKCLTQKLSRLSLGCVLGKKLCFVNLSCTRLQNLRSSGLGSRDTMSSSDRMPSGRALIMSTQPLLFGSESMDSSHSMFSFSKSRSSAAIKCVLKVS
mmetsp:Transcript_20426/g.62154  ORF Transcript_20426/g.62154 Transcript_20426/m.62154 type:complete len:252 (-) Transcript_20426:812-1567(-)